MWFRHGFSLAGALLLFGRNRETTIAKATRSMCMKQHVRFVAGSELRGAAGPGSRCRSEPEVALLNTILCSIKVQNYPRSTKKCQRLNCMSHEDSTQLPKVLIFKQQITIRLYPATPRSSQRCAGLHSCQELACVSGK